MWVTPLAITAILGLGCLFTGTSAQVHNYTDDYYDNEIGKSNPTNILVTSRGAYSSLFRSRFLENMDFQVLASTYQT